MARGYHLFTSLFDEDILPAEPPRQRKGRSDELNERRNELLLARYYWYGQFSSKRYGAVIKSLSTEFFLTERTIQDIIQTEYGILLRLKKLQPPEAYFRKQWPHLVWQ